MKGETNNNRRCASSISLSRPANDRRCPGVEYLNDTIPSLGYWFPNRGRIRQAGKSLTELEVACHRRATQAAIATIAASSSTIARSHAPRRTARNNPKASHYTECFTLIPGPISHRQRPRASQTGPRFGGVAWRPGILAAGPGRTMRHIRACR